MKKLTITLILVPIVGTMLYAKTTPGTTPLKPGHHCPSGHHNGLTCTPPAQAATVVTGVVTTLGHTPDPDPQNQPTGTIDPIHPKPVIDPLKPQVTTGSVTVHLKPVPVVDPVPQQVTTGSVTAHLKPVPVVDPVKLQVTTGSIKVPLNPTSLVPLVSMKVPPTPLVKPMLVPPTPMKVPPTPLVKPMLVPPTPMKVPPTPMVKPNLIPQAPMKVPPTPMVKPNLIPQAPMKVPPTPMVKPNLIPQAPMKVPPTPMVKPNLIPQVPVKPLHITVNHGETHGNHLPVAPKAHNCPNTITTSHHHTNPGTHVVLHGGAIAGGVVHTSEPTHHINTGASKGPKPITSGRYHTRTGYGLNVIEPGIQNKEVAVYRTDDARQMKYKDAIEIDHTGGFLLIDHGTRDPDYHR